MQIEHETQSSSINAEQRWDLFLFRVVGVGDTKSTKHMNFVLQKLLEKQ